ncbi:hypothetical protein [Rhizobium laguerreae]|uniref:Uncharacterized protein n=1 Tax=Rhizobium laguerreae TaxID=1076926 RepID=A0A6N9ZKZ4_9HYPH|nr:hypothetical protein [Rhizobium laguerreae]NEH94187.1 hypothetical protein [Rhizobium laguerreae]
MTLSVNESKNGQLKGVFEYSAGLDGRASYNVTGTVTPTGSFRIIPGSWIMHPTGFRAIGLQGQVGQSGSKRVIDGTLPECKPGAFRASLLPPVEAPPPPLAKTFDQDEWIKAVRKRLHEYVQNRESKQIWWNRLARDVDSSRVVDRPTKDTLLAEIREGRANVKADALLDELASGKKAFPGGMGQALRILDQARLSDWPDNVKLRVHEACKTRIVEVLRPILTEIAASAASMPNTLEGLAEARAALAPVEAYRQSLEYLFETFDQENLLTPMWQKIAELESNPAIATEFREAFAIARREPDPRAATEDVIRNVLGERSTSVTLADIAAEGRRDAALAEVVVESTASETDSGEPSASDIALFMYSVADGFNKTFAAMRCAPGDHDVTDAPKCILGELEIRLKRIVKTRCLAEMPGQQYACDFDQFSQTVSFRTGEPVQVTFDYPGGGMNGPQKVRFIRRINSEGWDGSRLNPG